MVPVGSFLSSFAAILSYNSQHSLRGEQREYNKRITTCHSFLCSAWIAKIFRILRVVKWSNVEWVEQPVHRDYTGDVLLHRKCG